MAHNIVLTTVDHGTYVAEEGTCTCGGPLVETGPTDTFTCATSGVSASF